MRGVAFMEVALMKSLPLPSSPPMRLKRRSCLCRLTPRISIQSMQGIEVRGKAPILCALRQAKIAAPIRQSTISEQIALQFPEDR